MTDILIIDVSSANAMGVAPGRGSIQDDLDWDWLVTQGVRGAYVEGYVGNDGSNLDFQQQIADAKAAGIRTGVYDFTFPLPNDGVHLDRDPIMQARLHASHDGIWTPGDLPTMSDNEWPTDLAKWGATWPQIQAWLGAYLGERDNLAGCRVGVYSDEWWWSQLPGNFGPVFENRALWCAGSSSWVKAPFAGWTLWQRTGQEIMVPTRSGRPPVKTDCSVFNGDDAAFDAFCGLT